MTERFTPATALMAERLEDFAADQRVPVPAAALALDAVSVLKEPSSLVGGWLARLDQLMPSVTAGKMASQERRMVERFGSPPEA
jgi:exonuclease VII large subunit